MLNIEYFIWFILVSSYYTYILLKNVTKEIKTIVLNVSFNFIILSY